MTLSKQSDIISQKLVSQKVGDEGSCLLPKSKPLHTDFAQFVRNHDKSTKTTSWAPSQVIFSRLLEEICPLEDHQWVTIDEENHTTLEPIGPLSQREK